MSKRAMVLTGIVALAALSRLVPHPPNVTPIAAMALFGSAFFGDRKIAYLVPLAAMLLSDIVLGYTIYGSTLLRSQPVVYACLIATVAMGRLIHDRRSPWHVGVVVLASSVLFFVVTNFAVWAMGPLYPKTWNGFATCYTAAIPFFRNSVVGDMVFSVVFFGGFVLLERVMPALREDRQLATY
ncbi:MAG: hypothetical protein HY288_04400 [Planctomycetia bacterium]|nr:hypothetical protein [Planctomycetia bacterium]